MRPRSAGLRGSVVNQADVDAGPRSVWTVGLPCGLKHELAGVLDDLVFVEQDVDVEAVRSADVYVAGTLAKVADRHLTDAGDAEGAYVDAVALVPVGNLVPTICEADHVGV